MRAFSLFLKASAKDISLRKSLQGECRTGLLADLYDRTVAADAVGVNSELGPLPPKRTLTTEFKNYTRCITPHLNTFLFYMS